MINAIGIPLLFNDFVDSRSDALLKAAYIYQVPAYYYAVSDIFTYEQTGSIHALFWNGAEYQECMTDLPKYTEIYCGLRRTYGHLKKEFDRLHQLTVSTDEPAMLKRELQRKLLFSPLSQYAIPTILVKSYSDLMSSCSAFNTSFLKPSGGHKAKGAMKIEHQAGKLRYATPENSGELTKEAFDAYYASVRFENKVLLLEPCLNILNDDGRAVDFRCLVSLNGEGKWQNVMTYARIGGTGVASNFSHGGSLNFAQDVLEDLIPGHGAEKLAEIDDVALQIAAFVQRESKDTVSWLGLDICVDRPSNQVYVIEANSKPGTKLVGPWPLALVRAQYFKYLLSNDKS